MNDCTNCANKAYHNGVGGPCSTCVENSNWHNDREERHVAASEQQIGGNHYKDKKVQPWQAMEAWMTPAQFVGFLRGNAIKYLARCDDKGGIEDIRKARHYLDKLIEFHESETRPRRSTASSRT